MGLPPDDKISYSPQLTPLGEKLVAVCQSWGIIKVDVQNDWVVFKTGIMVHGDKLTPVILMPFTDGWLSYE